ncbi:hypothetical protein CR513_31631, partial [Mucuna pruriens]
MKIPELEFNYSAKEVSKFEHIHGFMHHWWSYIHRHHAGPCYSPTEVLYNPSMFLKMCSSKLMNFYVLDMEDDTFEEGSALILGRPFFMTTKMNIDVHAGTLSVEFGDTYMEFNIFEALKHPAKDHSTFGVDTIDGLMEEYF